MFVPFCYTYITLLNTSQNNLAELWSLLNFILPDIFTNLDTFQEWFNLPSTASYSSSPRSTKLINTLHAVLRPFLLRRLKVDVETNLPPKKEYVLYAPLSLKQREVYDAVLNGHLRALLMKAGKIVEEREDKVTEEEGNGRKSRRRKNGAKRKKYDEDGDDDEYFRKLENGELEAERSRQNGAKTAEELGREWQYKAQRKSNSMYAVYLHLNTLYRSEEGQQYETAEHCDAASQSLFTSLPVRLAGRPDHYAADPFCRAG